MGRFVRKDSFFHKAKEQGFRARSAYKLKEIQDKYHLIRRGDRVLDLGCAPGSFLQVLSDLVGPSGLVVGIDILPVAPLPQKNVVVVRGDIREFDIGGFLAEQGVSAFDAVTCDIAPNLTGIREVDDRNVLDLYEGVKRILTESLKPGGTLIIKAFFSETFTPIASDLKLWFGKTSIFKPVASRRVSSETYFVCTKKK